MATTFDVLAEPHRRRILDELLAAPRSVTELVERLHLSQPQASKHLRVLRDAGLVSVHQEAQRRRYELRPEPLLELDAWLAPYRRLWADRLTALERHLDNMPGHWRASGAGVPVATATSTNANTPGQADPRADTEDTED
jgi:DNA-binding transcriptional ArsR family regulator